MPEMMDEHASPGPVAAPPPAAGPSSGFVPLAELAAPRRVPDFAAIRARLAAAQGKQLWRSLDELAGTAEFQQFLEREFPLQAPGEMAPLDRREFLRVMGATLALAGVAGCAYQPPEKIIPYLEQPEQIVPGKPLFYATAFPLGGYGRGVVGEAHMGRPIKLEGNTRHPSSLGGTDAVTQASLLTLYDPDRSQGVRQRGVAANWEVLLAALGERRDALRRQRGRGLRILTGAITSPTLEWQLRKLLQRFPEARVHRWEPVNRDSVHAGLRQAFGKPAQPVYHVAGARRILSLDSDFLNDEPGSVRYAHDFAAGRQVRRDALEMNRLYVLECGMSLTGANADHRLGVRPGALRQAARVLAAALGVPVEAGGSVEGIPAEWLSAVVEDLQAHRGSSLVIAGPQQPPAVHALAAAMNLALGNVGRTVTYTAPLEAALDGAADHVASLRALTEAINGGQVELLLILGVNAAYDGPADIGFGNALAGMRGMRVHMGLYDDETAALCEWHVPASHYLESWGDVRGHDGTVSLLQPLVTPLYGTRSYSELLSFLVDDVDRPGYEVLREYWSTRLGEARFERRWHEALLQGVVPGTAAPPLAVQLVPGALAAPAEERPEYGTVDVLFRPDLYLLDGSFANNGWLQELPRPITQLTWDNAALVSVKTAEQLNLANGDRVTLEHGGLRLELPVWVTPGQPEGAVTVHLGWGRTRAGRIGTGPGFNAYPLRTSRSLLAAEGARLTRTRGRHKLVSAQMHFSMEGRDLVRIGTLEEVKADPEHPHFMHGELHGDPSQDLPSLYPSTWPSDRQRAEPLKPGGNPGEWEGHAYNGLALPAWGMVIDLTACTGCNACTIACQAENNIPTVGKDQVDRNREMHWIRVDNYFTADLENPEPVFQPMPCMHCEKAPCEPVCPVSATTHSVEGINEMTYNRCVGTRYCSNNCPYKVRRFNFLQYSDQQTPSIQMMRNPDVTVRSRGVMEKCTFCIQRINQARMAAEKEDRRLRDGDVVTACQQACPSRAITFGDLNDTVSNGNKGSRVRQLKTEPLSYVLLEELNTRPRTSYLARLRNPNPALGGGAHGTAAHGNAAPASGANGSH